MPDTLREASSKSRELQLLAVEGLCGAAGCAAGTPPGDSRQRSQRGQAGLSHSQLSRLM